MLKKSMRDILRYKYNEPPPALHMLYNGTLVAELQKEKGEFVFRYLPAFLQMGLTALPGLPLGVETRGAELPSYFRERLPDTRRPDVLRLAKQFGIPLENELLLLATLGKHTVTDPFEFQLAAA